MTISTATRALDVIALARDVVSLDTSRRSTGAEWSWKRTHTGGLDEIQQALVGQLCVWAWIAESDIGVAEELMRALGVLGWVIPPAQIAGIAQSLDRPPSPGPAEDFLEDLDDYLLRDPDVAPHLLDPDAARRAVDLVRGLTSTLPAERLRATTMSAEVVASTSLTDEEARSFAGIVAYAVVVETDPTVRLEQARVLGLAARRGRLGEAYREVALTADLTDDERGTIDGAR